MFVNEEDYKVIVGEKQLRIYQQCDEGNRQHCEEMAIDEISGYLRGRYDVERVFAATYDERNKLIVMYTCDISLYNLSGSLPSQMNFEMREKRYNNAIKWLTEVQKGNIMPGLPTIVGPNGEDDNNNPIRYGAGQKNRYDW